MANEGVCRLPSTKGWSVLLPDHRSPSPLRSHRVAALWLDLGLLHSPARSLRMHCKCVAYATFPATLHQKLTGSLAGSGKLPVRVP